jgi:hypothetical protein
MTENGNLGEPITGRFYEYTALLTPEGEFRGWIKTRQPFPGLELLWDGQALLVKCALVWIRVPRGNYER